MLARSRLRILALALGSSLAALSCGSGGDAPRPDIVLITLESLRTDHVGAYGGRSRTRPELPTTPTLDALAGEAVVYPDAHSVTSWTLSSHASLFTGLYPSAHQTRMPQARLGDAYRTIAEELGDVGYLTAGVVSGPYLRRAHNLHQGFQIYDEEAASPFHGEGHSDVTNDHMERELLRFLEEERDSERPFFLFAYFWDPHFDFIPPAPYDSLFASEGVEPFDASDFDTNDAIHPEMSHARLDYLWSQYAGEIRATDELLGRLFARMRELGVWDESLVIVTADHGEEFFDHGEKGHKNNLHAETVHVPLFVKWPEGTAAPSPPGTRDERLVSLVDLAPTIFEVAGVRIDPALSGVSLLAPSDPERAVLYELYASEYLRDPAGTISARIEPFSAVRRGRYKLMTERLEAGKSPRLRLYDVASDPTERFDRGEARPEIVRELGAIFGSLRRDAQAVAERTEAGGTAELGDVERARLCALGYLDCDTD